MEQDDKFARGKGGRQSSEISATHRIEVRDIDPAIIRSFSIVVEGSNRKWESTDERCSIGSHASNDLVIEDSTVSRFHCEIALGSDGARINDLGSSNGTVVDGVRVERAFLRSGAEVRVGQTVLRFRFGNEENRLDLSDRSSFGALLGISVPMRNVFTLLERAAASNVTVLLEGETGTGKGIAAEAIHEASARGGGHFVVIDCGAIPENLLESELFGHERGAFTGADASRVGAFEDAAGGTVFLDEVGELPLDLQPKLLRVLENRTIRPVGSNQETRIDVRLLAATNRDLRAEVNAGRFREDLYYRLAVVPIRLPPLRERAADIPALVDAITSSLNTSPEQKAAFFTEEMLASLRAAKWPGNVRELRNYIERYLVFRDVMPMAPELDPLLAEGSIANASLDYATARKAAIDSFERAYVKELLDAHGGKVSSAAGAAKMNRVYLYRLLRKHGLTPR